VRQLPDKDRTENDKVTPVTTKGRKKGCRAAPKPSGDSAARHLILPVDDLVRW